MLFRSRGDREGSVQTTRTNRSQLCGKSHVSHVKNEIDMQRKIDELKKKLRRAQRRRSSPEFESSSEDTDDATYRRQSKTPPSETFSGDDEYSGHRRKNKSPMHKGLGNKAMNEALNQVAKSPFIRRIEGASLPR